jgi:hypothetical protein
MAQQDSTGEDEQEAKAYIRSGNDLYWIIIFKEQLKTL